MIDGNVTYPYHSPEPEWLDLQVSRLKAEVEELKKKLAAVDSGGQSRKSRCPVVWY